MARKKTPQVRVNVKAQISGRLRELRQELFGEHGGPELARRLDLPARTWYNYETGVTVPAEILLAFIEETGANPLWLLTGRGARYRRDADALALAELSAQQLIRRGLEKLEQASRPVGGEGVNGAVWLDLVPLNEVADHHPGAAADAAPTRTAADRAWIPHPSQTIASRLEDDAMAPILPAGSLVAIDRTVRVPKLLRGRIAAAFVAGRTVVRWVEPGGLRVVLRANVAGGPPPIDLGDEREALAAMIGQVVWSWSHFDPP